ncbi:MAG TPA: M56 family metallopeptidase [Thermoanaerobaculia bacterium]|nr:M56 family metallopeptidase [Thermoanaerobaculia bacterium]
MQLLTGPVAQALGWALLHLLWQATIVAGILAAVLALVPRRSANARYVLSISALALVFVMFVGTAIRAYDPSSKPILTTHAETAATSLEPANVPVLIATLAAESWRERLLSAVATARQSLPSVVAIWLLGVVVLSSRLMISWLRARSLVQKNTVEAGEHWQRAAARISHALGLKRAVRLLESAALEVPSVIGSLRPVILLPASTLTGLTPEQIEMVLAHELAHIRRHDFFVNLLQAFVETLMFYHPAVWWMSRRVRIERENCCDDLAVAVCGNPLQYARALTRLEELRDSALAVAVAANGGSLLERIRRIAVDRAEQTGISSRWAAAVAMLSIVVIALAVPSLPALAQREEKPATSTIDVVETHNTDTDADDNDTDVDDDGDMDVDTGIDQDVVDIDIDPDIEIDVPDVPEVPEAPEAPHAYVDLDDLDIAVAPVAAIGAIPPVPPTPRVRIAPAAMAAPVPPMPVTPAVPRTPRAPVAIAANNFDFDFDFDDDDQGSDREIGNGKLSVDELISLRASGVSADYVNKMRAVFPDLTLRSVRGLGAVGVTPEYVREMRSAGLEVDDAREATSLRAVGVTPEFVREMRSAGFELKSARDATSLRAVGVTSEFVRQMRDAGFKIESAKDITSLRAVGVTPEYIRQMRDAGFKIESAKDATSMRAVGVTPEYVRQMRDAGFKIESAKDASSMRAVGVTPEYIRDMRSAGVNITSAKDATSLRAVGVTPEFVKKLAAAGYSNLSVRELSRLAAAGVDDDFIRSMDQYKKKN